VQVKNRFAAKSRPVKKTKPVKGGDDPGFWTLKLDMSRLPTPGAVIKRVLKLTMWTIITALTMGVLAALLLIGYLYVSESNYFMVQPQSIFVSGLSRLSRNEVLEAAGLHIAVNNLTLDTTKAINNLKSVPWIKKAEISQTLPNGLSIKVVEYRPKAIVSLEHLYFIDENGTPFQKLEPGEISDLPLISGFTIDELSDSGPLVQDALAEIFALVEVLKDRHDEFKASNISEFHYDPDRGLTLFTRKTGLEVKVGLGGYEKKFWRLGRVITHLRREELLEGLAYVNLEYPMRVTVSYGGQGVAAARPKARPSV
jgi:cell division protein FtsQ